MADALDAFGLDGVRHNIPFLSALMAHPRWRERRLSTGFIAEEFPDGFKGAELGAGDADVLSAICVAVQLVEKGRTPREAGHSSRPPSVAGEWVLALGRTQVQVSVQTIEAESGRVFDIALDGKPRLRVETGWGPGEPVWRGTVDGLKVVAQVRRRGHAFQVERRGASATARLLTPRAAALDALMPEAVTADTSNVLRCPMPGLVVSVWVVDGQKVRAGETLAVMEAMKMENVLRAERDVTIARVLVRPGDSLAVDVVIMEFAAGRND
jgi:propionyl-CoA carboxylase alpha chain